MFNGLGMNQGNLSWLSNAQTRSISPENFTGEPGKGGMAVALHQEFELPTFFAGLGEQPGDLQPFSPEFFAAALFGGKGE